MLAVGFALGRLSFSSYAPFNTNNYEAPQGKTIDSFVTYTIPSGWNKRIEKRDVRRINTEEIPDQTYSLILTSPDYKEKVSGMKISLARSEFTTSPQGYISLFMNGRSKGYTDIEEATVGNYFAVRSHYDDYNQGHFLEYKISQNDKYLWTLYVDTKSLATEREYQSTIDSFINSLQFK